MSKAPMPQARQSAGTPKGGQYSTAPRGEADVELAADTNQRVLGADAVRAVGRFDPDGPHGYQAVSVPDAPMRPTREEALADERAHWQQVDAAYPDADREMPTVVAAFNGIEAATVRESFRRPGKPDGLADVPDAMLDEAIQSRMPEILHAADRAYAMPEDEAWTEYQRVCSAIATDALLRNVTTPLSHSEIVGHNKHLGTPDIAKMERAWFDRDAVERDRAVKTAWEVVQGTDVEKSWRETTHLPIPVRFAAIGAATRGLIGQGRYTQRDYDLLTAPWRKVIGSIHPDDSPPTRETS